MSKSSSAAKAAQPAAPAAATEGDHATQPQANTGAEAATSDAGADAAQAGAGASNGAEQQANDAGALTAPSAAPARMRAVVIYQGGALSQPIGTVIEGPADAIDRLEIAGDVDSHPSAVEAALAGGAAPVSVE